MIQLIVLIIATIILLIVFIVLLISAFIKKTKSLFILSAFSFLLLFGTGMYTLYFGLKTAGKFAKTTIERVFPTFNSDIPDTEANKKNFRAFLKIDITPDINNIYCFDDAIGANADYMFSFNCDSITVKKIIERNELKKDSLIGNNAEGMQHDFFWWDKKKIRELERYSWNSNNEKKKNIYKFFWYDKDNQKAYYFEYDM